MKGQKAGFQQLSFLVALKGKPKGKPPVQRVRFLKKNTRATRFCDQLHFPSPEWIGSKRLKLVFLSKSENGKPSLEPENERLLLVSP